VLNKPPLWSATLLLFCLCAFPAAAQVSAVLSGRVTDQSGAVVSGATVAATNQDTGIARSAVTNQAGLY